MNNSTANRSDNGWLDLPEVNNIQDFILLCCSSAVIFGGLVPYVPQYLKIKRSKDSSGFSTYVCLTLLIANILRIMFWFGHDFEKPLLIQSFLMSAGMLAMVEICVRARNYHSSSYQISTIGFGPNLQRRRFQIGKLIDGDGNDDDDNDDEFTDDDIRVDESMPIYPVSPSPSYSASPTISNHYIPDDRDRALLLSNQVESQSQLQFQAPLLSTDSSVAFEVSNDSNVRRSNSVDSANQSEFQDGPASNNSNLASSQNCQASLMGQTSLVGDNDKWGLNNFWNWNDFMSYIKFLALFTLIIGLITFLLVDCPLYVEILGSVALITESMLGMPQLMRNHMKKSTRGMSVEMVVLWLSGDLFKTTYFWVRNTPAQFYVCGSIQVIVDILILLQVFLYKQPNVTYRRLPKTN